MDPTDTTTQATVCTDCGNIQANLQTVRGGLVCDNCIEGYTYVHCCEEHVHNDNVCYTEDEGGVYICDDCVNGPERKICADCGELHRRRNMVRHEGDECYYCSDCIEVHCEDEDEDEDDEQPTDTTGRINNTAAAQAHLPILEATSVPTQLQEHLREFYGRHVLDNVYSYKAIQATGTIQLPNTAAAMVYKNLRDKLREKYAYAQQEVIRCCKYYDTTSVHSEGAIVHYKAIDNVGKTQHRKEHINKVADYYKTRYNIAVDYDVRAMQTNDYSVELSNSIEAKLLQGQANEDYRRSCQVPDNKHYYSK